MRVLIVSRSMAPYDDPPDPVDGGDSLTVLRPGSALYGERFDLIVVPEDFGDRFPSGEAYRQWIDVAVRCRLEPEGRMIWT